MDWLERELANPVVHPDAGFLPGLLRVANEKMFLGPAMYRALKAEADNRGETIPDWVIEQKPIPYGNY